MFCRSLDFDHCNQLGPGDQQRVECSSIDRYTILTTATRRPR